MHTTPQLRSDLGFRRQIHHRVVPNGSDIATRTCPLSILHARVERDGAPLRENKTKWGVSYDNDLGICIFAA